MCHVCMGGGVLLGLARVMGSSELGELGSSLLTTLSHLSSPCQFFFSSLKVQDSGGKERKTEWLPFWCCSYPAILQVVKREGGMKDIHVGRLKACFSDAGCLNMASGCWGQSGSSGLTVVVYLFLWGPLRVGGRKTGQARNLWRFICVYPQCQEHM